MDKRNELHSGHRERLRQRLIAEGVDHFEPHELLEFLLCYAIPRQNVNHLAHELLNYFGNLRNVLNAQVSELTQVKGMGEHAALWLNKLGQCVDACGQIEPHGFLKLSRSNLVIESIRDLDWQPAPPCMMQLCLNRNNGLLYRRIICSSRDWGEPDVLREALRDVFSTGARGVILVFFPGDGPLLPSQYDLKKVKDYSYALNTADCELLEMLLINGDQYYSLRRCDQIPEQYLNEKAQHMREEYIPDLPAGQEGDTPIIHHTQEEKHERTESV